MSRKLICLLFVAALLMPASAMAAAEPDDFVVDSTQDLIDLCATSPDNPLYTAAIHFCHGYLVGAYAYYEAANAGPEGEQLVCFPDPAPSRNDAVKMFVDWAKAHPEYMNEPAVESEFRFLMEKWPCKE